MNIRCRTCYTFYVKTCLWKPGTKNILGVPFKITPPTSSLNPDYCLNHQFQALWLGKPLSKYLEVSIRLFPPVQIFKYLLFVGGEFCKQIASARVRKEPLFVLVGINNTGIKLILSELHVWVSNINQKSSISTHQPKCPSLLHVLKLIKLRYIFLLENQTQ